MQISENNSVIIGCFLAEGAGQACVFLHGGYIPMPVEVKKLLSPKLYTVRIEAESEIGTARKIGELPTTSSKHTV